MVTLKHGKSMPCMAEDEEDGNRGGEKVQVFNYVPFDEAEKILYYQCLTPYNNEKNFLRDMLNAHYITFL